MTSHNDNPWVTTYSGIQFFCLNPDPGSVRILDIAHGLSNICRYMGQCREFYSVAEHCVRMAEYLQRTRHITFMSAMALFHDAPEAYLSDINSTLKDRLPEYKRIEEGIASVIYKVYGVPTKGLVAAQCGAAVKELDVLIRTAEVRSLFNSHNGWVLRDFDYPKIKPWSPRKAERKYLETFRRIYGTHFNYGT